jgi:hypothetical protein
MILSDREIIAALKRHFVRITPEPDPSNSDKRSELFRQSDPARNLEHGAIEDPSG